MDYQSVSEPYKQVIADTISDLCRVPVFFIREHTSESLFEALVERRFSPFGPIASAKVLSDFLSHASPLTRYEVLSNGKAEQSWRSFFWALEGALYDTRPQVSDLFVHKLRRHWYWRWSELLEFAKISLGRKPAFYTQKNSEHLFLRDFQKVEGQGVILCLGPVKNGFASADEKFSAFDQYLDDLIAKISEFGFELRSSKSEILSHFSERIGLKPEIFRARAKMVLNLVTSLNRWATSSPLNLDRKLVRMVIVTLFSELQLSAQSRDGAALSEILIKNEGQIDILLSAKRKPSIGTRLGRRKLLSRTYGLKQVTYRDHGRLTNAKLPTAYASAIADNGDQLADAMNVMESLRIAEAEHLIHDTIDKETKFHFEYDETSKFGLGLEYRDRIGKIARRISRITARTLAAKAVRIYYFDRDNRSLVTLGGHVDGIGMTKELLDPYMAEYNAERHSDQSIALAAATDAKAKLLSPSSSSPLPSPGYNFDYFASYVRPSPNSVYPIPQSLIAVPILIHDRVWGVIEAGSEEDNFFSHKEISILNRFSEAVGNDLHALNVTRIFSSLGSDVLDDNLIGHGESQAVINKLANRVRDLFMGSSASVWLRDLFDHETYALVGDTEPVAVTEEPSALELAEEFQIGDDTSVSARVLRDRQRVFIGEIGVQRLNESWRRNSDRRRRIATKYRGIIIIGLYDREEHPIGSISVYGKTNFDPKKWTNLGEFVSRYCSSIVEYLLGNNLSNYVRVRLDQHEIANNILPLRTRMNDIQEDVLRRYPEDEDLKAMMSQFVEDQERYLDQIHFISSTSHSSRRDINKPVVRTRLNESDQPPEYVDIHEEVNFWFKALQSQLREKSIELQIDYSQFQFAILGFRQDIAHILRNLSSNAIKHSPPHSTIRVSAKAGRFTRAIEIRNISEEIEFEEEEKLFRAQYRGKAALDKEVEGQGLGLFVVDQICRQYKFELTYYQKSFGNKGLAWHSFLLVVPGKIITETD